MSKQPTAGRRVIYHLVVMAFLAMAAALYVSSDGGPHVVVRPDEIPRANPTPARRPGALPLPPAREPAVDFPPWQTETVSLPELLDVDPYAHCRTGASRVLVLGGAAPARDVQVDELLAADATMTPRGLAYPLHALVAETTGASRVSVLSCDGSHHAIAVTELERAPSRYVLLPVPGRVPMLVDRETDRVLFEQVAALAIIAPSPTARR